MVILDETLNIMSPQQTFKQQVGAGTFLEFVTSDTVFYPTGTSGLLIDAVRGHVKQVGSVLDLGCGSGVVGISLDKLGFVSKSLHLSDASPDAVAVAKQNADLHQCSVDARAGSLYEPWQGMKFDCIIDDVSGVAEAIAEISPWFKNVPCSSGGDGADLVVEVLENAPTYLEEGGMIFFPVLSLSNTKRILSAASQNFKNVERLLHKTWPLPEEMKEHANLIRELAKKDMIQIEEKFGMMLWYTDVYVAYN